MKHQFRLISLFQVTTLSAFFIFLLVPFVRPSLQQGAGNWQKPQYTAIGFVVFQIGLVCAMAICTLYLRRRIEGRSGRCVFHTYGSRFRPLSTRRFFRSLLGLLPVPFAMLFLFDMVQLSWWMLLHPLVLGIQLLLAYEVARNGLSLLLDIDYDDIEIYEQGLIHGAFQLWTWDDIASIEAAPDSPDKVIVRWTDGRSYRNAGAMTKIRIPAAEQTDLLAAAAPFLNTAGPKSAAM